MFRFQTPSKNFESHTLSLKNRTTKFDDFSKTIEAQVSHNPALAHDMYSLKSMDQPEITYDRLMKDWVTTSTKLTFAIMNPIKKALKYSCAPLSYSIGALGGTAIAAVQSMKTFIQNRSQNADAERQPYKISTTIHSAAINGKHGLETYIDISSDLATISLMLPVMLLNIIPSTIKTVYDYIAEEKTYKQQLDNSEATHVNHDFEYEDSTDDDDHAIIYEKSDI